MLVTGGTGFIGSRLVERLVADGESVRLLARNAAAVPVPWRSRVEIVTGDLRDREAVSRAMHGADIAYHLAGVTKVWVANESEFHETNALGTRNVCVAAEEQHLTRLVHVSTALLEPPPPHSGVDGATRLTAYQRSKAEGERELRRYIERGGKAVIVRPTRVFGPGPLTQSNSATRMINLYRRGIFRINVGDRSAQANYVFVEDVVNGMILAAERGVVGEAYALGGENCTIREFLEHVVAAGARSRKLVDLPPQIARLVAAGAELTAHIGIHPAITSDWLRVLIIDWPVSSDLAQRRLGYSPTPLREGVQRTVRWLEDRHPESAHRVKAEPVTK